MSDTPRTVHAWADTVRVGRCNGRANGGTCDAKIFFAENTRTGKSMPFNGDPVPLREYMDPDAVDKAGNKGRKVYVLNFDTNHFGTCPDRKSFGRGRR